MADFRSLASVTATLSAARLVGVGMTFLTQLILARQLAPEELGLFFLSSGIATALSVFTALGYPNLAARMLARARGGRGRSHRSAFLRQARNDMALAGILAMVATLAVAFLVWDRHHAIVVGLGLLSVPPLAQSRLLSAIGNADRRMVVAYMPELVFRPAGLLVAVLTAAALGWPIDAGGLILVFVALALFVMVWTQVALARGRELGAEPERPASARLVRSWRRGALPLVLVALFTAAFADASVAVVGFFLDLADLAVFTMSLKIAWLGGYAIQTVQQAVLPDVADLVHSRRARLLGRHLATANRLALAVALVFVLGAAVAGRLVLSIFGPEYAAGADVLVVLALSHAIRAAAGPGVQVLTVSGHGRLLGWLSLVSFAVLVAATALLTPTAGRLGAAVAVTLAMSLWSVASSVLVRTRLGARCDVFAAGRRGRRPDEADATAEETINPA